MEPFNQAIIERKHMQQKNEKIIVAKQPDTLREFFRPRDPNGKFTQTLELNIKSMTLVDDEGAFCNPIQIAQW